MRNTSFPIPRKKVPNSFLTDSMIIMFVSVSKKKFRIRFRFGKFPDKFQCFQINSNGHFPFMNRFHPYNSCHLTIYHFKDVTFNYLLPIIYNMWSLCVYNIQWRMQRGGRGVLSPLLLVVEPCKPPHSPHKKILATPALKGRLGALFQCPEVEEGDFRDLGRLPGTAHMAQPRILAHIEA